MNILKIIEGHTDISANSWYFVRGPEAGGGAEYWLRTDHAEDDEGNTKSLICYLCIDTQDDRLDAFELYELDDIIVGNIKAGALIPEKREQAP